MHGGTVDGYIFSTNEGTTGYYLNDDEAQRNRTAQPPAVSKPWLLALQEVIWPTPDAQSAPSDTAPDQTDGNGAPASWIARKARGRRFTKGRKRKGKRGTIDGGTDMSNLNYTTLNSTLAKDLGLCAIDS